MTKNTPSIGAIHEDYCTRIKGMLDDIGRDFPDSFKSDPRYQEIVDKFNDFIDKYSK